MTGTDSAMGSMSQVRLSACQSSGDAVLQHSCRLQTSCSCSSQVFTLSLSLYLAMSLSPGSQAHAHTGKLASPFRYPAAEEAEDGSKLPSKLRGMPALAFPTLLVQEEVLEPAAAAIQVRPLMSAQLRASYVMVRL